MIKTLMAQIKQYKKDTILTPIFTALEVLFEVVIPLITAKIIDDGISAGNMSAVVKYGIIMIIVAFPFRVPAVTMLVPFFFPDTVTNLTE